MRFLLEGSFNLCDRQVRQFNRYLSMLHLHPWNCSRIVWRWDKVWPFDARRFAIQTIIFRFNYKSLEHDWKYSDLIGRISVLNCLYLCHYLVEKVKILQYWLFWYTFSEFKVKIAKFLEVDILWRHT